MTDRVTFRHGFTRPAGGQYEHDRFDLELVTDVRPDESASQAMERARAFVLGEARRHLPPVAAGVDRPAVHSEPFDPSNPTHVRIANMVLDDAGVQSENARGFKIRKLFPGERIGDLAEVLRRDEEAFRGGRRAGGSVRPFRVGRNDGSKSGWDGRWRS